jgi:tetratricopeptide (TPR) repeat protein
MANLASTFENQGKYSDSRCLYEGAIVIWTKLYGQSHPEAVHALENLAGLHRSQRDTEKVMELYKEILENKRKNNGEQHPRNLPSIRWLASLYFRRRLYAESEVMLRQELEIRRNEDGDTNIKTRNVMICLGAVCFEQKRYKEAWQFWKEELEIRSRIGGWISHGIKYIYNEYDRVERYADAKKYLEEALEIQLRSTRQDEDLELTRSYLADLEQKLENLARSAATSKGHSSDTVSAPEAQVRPTGLQIVDNPPAASQSATPQITPPLPDDAGPTVSAASASTSTRSVVYSRAEVVLVPLLLAAVSVFLPTINP